jgi:integrase
VTKARALLKLREGDIERGGAITPKMRRLTFDEAADDLLNGYTINNRRSLKVAERRIKKHLTPFFTGRRMALITTADVRKFIAVRQEQGVVHHRTGQRIRDVTNAELNRETFLLRRMFSLAIKDGKLLSRPHIPKLEESAVRAGFFEPHQYEAATQKLPEELRPVVQFARATGWRVDSKVLTLEWRNVDLAAGEITLDPGVAKNKDGRTFPITLELRDLLVQQASKRDAQKKRGFLCPLVFFG